MSTPNVDDWRHRAACRDEDPELFFPGVHNDQLAQARAVCYRCPVRRACLEWALARPEMFGVWGGMSERERKPLRGERFQARRAELRRVRLEARAS